MSETFDIWRLLAGLGFFLFGIFLMEDSIRELAGYGLWVFVLAGNYPYSRNAVKRNHRHHSCRNLQQAYEL